MNNQRRKLLILGTVLALLTLAFALALTIFLYANTRENARNDIHRAARIHATYVSRSIRAFQELTRHVARVLNQKQVRDDHMEAYLRGIKKYHTDLLDIAVLDSKGRIRYWTARGKKPPVVDRPYFARHKKGVYEETFLDQVFESRLHPGRWFFSVSRAVHAGTRLEYVVVFFVDLRHFRRAFPNLLENEDISIRVRDERGVVITTNPHTARLVGTTPAARTSGFLYSRAIDLMNGGLPRKNVWHVEAHIHQRAIYARFLPGTTIVVLLTIIFLGLIFAYINTGIRSLKRIHALNKSYAAARDEAREALNARMRFLANTSHELRTPMNVILGFSDPALNEDDPASAPGNLRKIHSAAAGLLDLLNDILDMTKIESGGYTLSPEPFSPAGLLNEVLEATEPLARAVGVKLTGKLTTPSEDLFLNGDSNRIRQIFINLISNGIKFTEAGGQVTLDLRLIPADNNKSALRFRCDDTGIGIKQEDLPLLFAPFKQIEESGSRRFQGTGLGLAISRGLAELMGGSLTVKSTAGKGSEFSFQVVLPHASGANPGKGGEQRANIPTTRILVVDDHEMNLLLVERLLLKEGALVTTASGGHEALRLIEANQFDCILLDLQMPDLDGYETARRIRALHPELPLIALTANALPEEKARALTAGMRDYVSKPINIAGLTAAIARATRSIN